MIKWVIPDNMKLRGLNYWTLDFMQKNPDFFIKDAKIAVAYGVMHDTILSGGRVTSTETISSIRDMRSILTRYNEHHVRYHLVLTQSNIKDEYLTDFWANKQLELVEEFGGGVILASDKLAKYVIEKYPKLKIIASTTKMNNTETFLKNIENKEIPYDVLVLNTANNFDYDFIPPEYRHKIETLIDDCCPPLCYKRAFCYNNSALANLGDDIGRKYPCNNDPKHMTSWTKYPTVEESRIKYKEFLRHHTREDVDKAHKDGFELMKFSGREALVFNVLKEYGYYMATPEKEYTFIVEGIDSLLDREYWNLIKQKRNGDF